MRQALLHQTMQIPRLMCAVKIAQTDVNNPGRQARTIIGRNRDPIWQRGKRCV